MMFNNRKETIMSTINTIGNFVWASDSNKKSERTARAIPRTYVHAPAV